MTQRQVDLQKLLELDRKRYQESQQLEKKDVVVANIPNPLHETITSLENEVNLDIFLSDKDNSKKEAKKYSSTKVKARNFLTNVSYTGIKNKDYSNRSFVVDIYSFLILYLNPYNLDGKFETPIERDYVNVLWTYLLPSTLYNFICKDNNVKILNKTNAKFQHAVEIINQFMEDETIGSQIEQFNTLKEYLIKYSKLYQFVFGNLFPRYFGKIDNYGIQSKIKFNSHYKKYLFQKNALAWEEKCLAWQIPQDVESAAATAAQSSMPINLSPLDDFLEIKEEEEKETVKKQQKTENKIKKRKEKKRKPEEALNEKNSKN